MLTLIVATHNGERSLPATLEAFAQMQAPQGGWQLIVVDNASDDRSADILSGFSERLPLTVLQQPQRGKNVSLNLALDYLQGDLVVFTDDDIAPAADWLEQMRSASDANPGFDLFGGAITPRWPGTPPDWVHERIPTGVVYGATPADREEGPCAPGAVWGGNMAVRRSVFEAGHRFDETVGPMPGQYRMGSETEFNARVVEAGYRAWYHPGARVEHLIELEQVQPQWVIRRAYRFGRDMFWKRHDPALGAADNGKEKTLAGIPRWIFRDYLSNQLATLRARALGDVGGWVEHGWQASYWRGYLHEAFGDGRHLRRR